MKMSLSSDLLYSYVVRLLSHYLPDGMTKPAHGLALFDMALQRIENCFSKIKRKYYFDNGGFLFDHLNCDHMATLLYFYGNTIWRETGDCDLPTRLFYLNKIMHGLDLFYSLKMPDVFFLIHPVGTVLGNAEYGDYLVVYQNCTVGSVKTIYPRFGNGTILYSKSSVIGNCTLGNDVVIAANTLLIDTNVPGNTVVTGHFPANRFRTNKQSVRSRCFE